MDRATEYLENGNKRFQKGEFKKAIKEFSVAIQLNPQFSRALHNRALAYCEMKQYQLAIEDLEVVLQLEPSLGSTYNILGFVYSKLNDFSHSLFFYEKFLDFAPDNPEAFFNCAVASSKLDQPKGAIGFLDKAIGLYPNYAEAYNNRGVALNALREYQKAIKNFECAVSINPNYADAYGNMGISQASLNLNDEAILSFEKAIAFDPRQAEFYFRIGNVLYAKKQYERASQVYQATLERSPKHASALHNLAICQSELGRYEIALELFRKALRIQEDVPFCFGAYFYNKLRICDWLDYDSDLRKCIEGVEQGKKIFAPFEAVGSVDEPSIHLSSARKVADEVFIKKPYNLEFSIDTQPKRIRIGYYSADFHNHATAYLMAELFEVHDRERFEVYGFSFGPNGRDEMRIRLENSFDHFYDVSDKTDYEVVELSRRLGVHIAVDLKGYTKECRPGIFSARSAPIQVSYLGYPGTMGAGSMDYVIGDHTVFCEENRSYCSEKIVYMPGSYQVNDSRRRIADIMYSKADLGLPEICFVYCCFNNNYKITPSVFDSWMKILKSVDNSVLWLFQDNPVAAENLKQEARRRGVDDSRLIFADRMPLEHHLARQKVADLFLDTLPYNAHTTASDALFVGLPVLTRIGKAFAGRVAASLLMALNLPELITETVEEYEALAIECGNNPMVLMEIKEKLNRNRQASSLFNAEMFARHLEIAFDVMFRRYLGGLPLEDIDLVEIRSN